MRMLLVAIGLLLGFGTPLLAGDISEHQVAAEAKWLVQIDLDAARKSTIGKKFHAAMLKHDKSKQRLRAASEALGLDPTKDVHGLLLYDRRFAHQRGVLIIQADIDLKKLTAFVEKLPDYKKTNSGGQQFHTFTHKTHKSAGHAVTVCFHDKGTVLGRDKDDVVAAVKVLDGKSANLTTTDSPIGRLNTSLPALPPGVILHIRATGLDADDVPFKSPIVRQSKTLMMIAGEREGKAFAHVTLTANSKEVAQQIKAVVEGFIAVAQMQCGKNEEAKNLFRAVKVKVDDSLVTIDWKGPTDDLLKLIEKRMNKRGNGRHGKKHNRE